MLLTALKPDAELRTTPPRLLPLAWRPGNFLDVLTDPAFVDWLRVSLVVAGARTDPRRVASGPPAHLTPPPPLPGLGRLLFLRLSARRLYRRARWGGPPAPA